MAFTGGKRVMKNLMTDRLLKQITRTLRMDRGGVVIVYQDERRLCNLQDELSNLRQ